jgi:hypothetical protein
MSLYEYTTFDKSSWGPGPWQDEEAMSLLPFLGVQG